jgi:Thiamine monophosphate synthase
MSTTSAAIDRMAQDIVRHHAATFAGFAPQPMPRCDTQEPVYRAALQACSTLGFIAADAHCLARAWQARTQRTGQFSAADWPDDPRDFGLRLRNGPEAFAACPMQLGLYAVLPDAAWVERMAHAGVPTVQLRFKSSDPAAIAREVAAAAQACARHAGAALHQRPLARRARGGAYGVHLGQEDLDALHPKRCKRCARAACAWA